MNQPIPFGIVIPSGYGPVVVNRYDTNQTEAVVRTGLAFNHNEITSLCAFLQSAPEGAVCLDVGANFGLYALAFAHTLASKHGHVHAFEAQRILAYMAAGTAVLNGLQNLFVHHQAVGAAAGRIPIPQFDYNKVSSFGSIEFGLEQKEFIGQPRLNQPDKQEYVDVVRLDDLELDKVHLVKIDVEGMEEDVLDGAGQLIERDKPVLCIEWIKSGKEKLVLVCKEQGYRVFEWAGDLLCVHPEKQESYHVNVSLKEL